LVLSGVGDSSLAMKSKELVSTGGHYTLAEGSLGSLARGSYTPALYRLRPAQWRLGGKKRETKRMTRKNAPVADNRREKSKR
jgi:hypothetical protein